MNNETRELEVPSLNPVQVEAIMTYANEKLPTKYGSYILEFIKNIAIELDRQKSETAVEEVKTTE